MLRNSCHSFNLLGEEKKNAELPAHPLETEEACEEQFHSFKKQELLWQFEA